VYSQLELNSDEVKVLTATGISYFLLLSCVSTILFSSISFLLHEQLYATCDTSGDTSRSSSPLCNRSIDIYVAIRENICNYVS